MGGRPAARRARATSSSAAHREPSSSSMATSATIGASTAESAGSGRYANIASTDAARAWGRTPRTTLPGRHLHDRGARGRLLVRVPGGRIERAAIGQVGAHRPEHLGRLLDRMEELGGVQARSRRRHPPSRHRPARGRRSGRRGSPPPRWRPSRRTHARRGRPAPADRPPRPMRPRPPRRPRPGTPARSRGSASPTGRVRGGPGRRPVAIRAGGAQRAPTSAPVWAMPWMSTTVGGSVPFALVAAGPAGGPQSRKWSRTASSTVTR